MTNPFVRKLEYGAELTDDDRRVLAGVSGKVRQVPARTEIIGEGEIPDNVHLVQSGLACRYKFLSNGARQIMAFFVPGDICDLHVHILGLMDHSIGTLMPSEMVELPPDVISSLTAHQRINQALWWATLVDEATLREWLVNMGQRPADKQMAHLFCELLVRLKSVGLGNDDVIDISLTQEELADTLGITPVHANRTLMALRETNLVLMERRHVRVPDLGRLMAFCDFRSNYLHLRDRRTRDTTPLGLD